MIFKNRWKNNRNIGIFCIVFVIFLVCFIIRNIFLNNNKQKITEEWIDISDFPNTLEIDKEGKLLSYPEVTILSETDGELVSLNVDEGDIVEERDVLMQIGNEEDSEETIDKLDRQIGRKYAEFYENMDEYNEFEMNFGQEISELERELLEYNSALQIATDLEDIKTKTDIENRIQDANKKLIGLKNERDRLKNNTTNLENEINSVNKESLNLYYEFDKQTTRATIPGIIGNIYVQEGDEIKNGDKLCTIIDNTYSPEIAVGLDFNEYILTQDLTGVMIITENENRGNSYYEGEIYTRSPKINENGEYILTVRILEEVSDLILSDKNTKITVVFTKDFPTIWIPENCFTEISNNTGNITLRDGEIITGKEIGIKNKWDNWINVYNLTLFGLENEEEKDGMNLCIEDWNKIIKNWDNDPILHEDESLIEWRNQFDNVEDLCNEFIKVNPMYWSGHRNTSIVSLLGGSGEKIEVLCRIE